MKWKQQKKCLNKTKKQKTTRIKKMNKQN